MLFNLKFLYTGSKWLAVSFTELDTDEQIVNFFRKVFVFNHEQSTGEGKNSFNAMSQRAFQVFLEAKLSKGRQSLTVIQRFVKIVKQRVNDIYSHLYVLFQTLPRTYLLDSMEPYTALNDRVYCTDILFNRCLEDKDDENLGFFGIR